MMMDSADRLSEIGNGNHHAEPVKIWKARRFIEENSTEKISLTEVAKMLGMSATHLSEKFKEVTGINFVVYIARWRFVKARALLDDLDLRISEIAFAVGFQSLSQFNRVFKKFTGKSPTEYRAREVPQKKSGGRLAEKMRSR